MQSTIAGVSEFHASFSAAIREWCRRMIPSVNVFIGAEPPFFVIHNAQGILGFGEVALDEAFHVFEEGEEGLDGRVGGDEEECAVDVG
jgi:hypothetical protein